MDTYAGVKGAWSPELNKPTPNVTYNVVAQVDGGLQNTFTLVMDNKGHVSSASGHITPRHRSGPRSRERKAT